MLLIDNSKCWCCRFCVCLDPTYGVCISSLRIFYLFFFNHSCWLFSYEQCTYALFTDPQTPFFSNFFLLKIGFIALFTYLKIILLPCFQFSIFSKNKLFPNEPFVSLLPSSKEVIAMQLLGINHYQKITSQLQNDAMVGKYGLIIQAHTGTVQCSLQLKKEHVP